ncbi:MAG: glycoside hydrolase family 3 [Balneola sp.]|jgi:beta-N-acetylhexosaminidase|nr:glycoside hydrolase family 3 [Balneola sp.]MAO76941.1 glycoside hydrolase family 3 [Balneola sp.]MBF64508.1 glycoside hydrolase family 3 [Balneola sp.]MBF65760.1 glycoside hydrolase family 3 [Balneola sp.]|tara:strand:+ start:1548 stop:2609 length:1062 start_codon:yes stop_codon:yes gene_type:complete
MQVNQLTIKDLSLKEKIAQLFLIGFHGNECSEGSEISKLLSNIKPGGVILFDKDMVFNKPVHNIKSPEQLKKLTAQLQEVSEIPLLIGIDQEGGLINRLKPEYGFPKTKSHHELGQINNPEVTLEEGLLISEVLHQHGININFAPCVDLALNAESSIIAKRERCFGATSSEVNKHAEAYVHGHQKNNVLTACKHFPGHGSAAGDTHAGFVDVTDTWEKDELEPYKYMIQKELCPVIMTSHIFNGNFDDVYPATLSKKTIQDLLRKQLGFEGVVISDDMQMRAISDHYGMKESLKLGLEAGIDVFCYGNNLLKEQIDLEIAINTIEELVANGEITETRIDNSVERILNLKKQLL